MKKVIAALLTLVLCMSVCAYAEAVPSKTQTDLVKVEVLSEGCEGFALVLTEIADGTWIADKVTEMADAESPVAVLNPIAVKDAIGADNWEVNEVYAATVTGYTAEMKDIDMQFTFPTAYADDQAVGVVITFADGTAFGFPATSAAGSLTVSLSAEVLERLSTEEGMLTVINAPAN